MSSRTDAMEGGGGSPGIENVLTPVLIPLTACSKTSRFVTAENIATKKEIEMSHDSNAKRVSVFFGLELTSLRIYFVVKYTACFKTHLLLGLRQK